MAAGTLKSPFTPRQHDRFGSGLMLLKIGGEGAVVGALEIRVIPPAECLVEMNMWIHQPRQGQQRGG